MSKSDPIEKALNAIGALRGESSPERLTIELRRYLRDRSHLIVAKAAKLAGELRVVALTPEMVAAFERLMKDPAKLDKRCAAVTAIVEALYELDHLEPEVYLRGLHHVQMEGSFGPPVDAAAVLRGISAQGLLRTRYPQALTDVVSLLVDREPPARLGAVSALATNGGDAGVLLLRLKVLTGDKDPDVLGECFASLLAVAPEQSLAFVSRFIENEDETAEAAIWAIGQSRLAAGLEMLKEKFERTVDRTVRTALIGAMAASRLPDAVEFLCLQVRRASFPIATEVIAALAPYSASEVVTRTVRSAVEERGQRALTESFKQQFEVA